jgi:hypothetical protein
MVGSIFADLHRPVSCPLVTTPFTHQFASHPSLDTLDDHRKWRSLAFDHYGPHLWLQQQFPDTKNVATVCKRVLDHGEDTDGGLLPTGAHLIGDLHSGSC